MTDHHQPSPTAAAADAAAAAAAAATEAADGTQGAQGSSGTDATDATDATTATGAPTALTQTPFDRLGGEVGVRALVDRFYDLMDLEPAYARLRAIHPTPLDGSRDKLFWFLCGWLGGPDHYIDRFGHPRLRARHMPYAIGIAERDQWMACMIQALDEQGVEPALGQRLTESFFGTADWMRNR